LYPESRGSVTLRSADPHDKPKLHFNLLSTENDREAFRRYIRFTRKFWSQPAAKALITREIDPGEAAQSDDEIDAYVRRIVSTAMHPTSTCAMGSGPEAVLDEKLRVRGVERLRVVDCSAMPLLVGGNTNAPAIMIGEKAADLIRETT
jgi:choline dehydrogenase